MTLAPRLVLAAACLLPSAALASSAGRCGGTGGTKQKTLECPAGQYIVGIGARGRAFVDEFSIACQKIPVSGTPGSRGGFKSAGPGGGTSTNSDLCDAGHALTTLHVKSGALVDKVEFGRCYPREGDGWKLKRTEGSVPSVQIGGGGGISCTIDCPKGEALFKVTVKSGGVVDSLRGECRK